MMYQTHQVEAGGQGFAPESSTGRLPGFRSWHTADMDSHDRTTDLDLEILDLLREGPRSAYRLAGSLSHKGEDVDTEAVRSRLMTLASRGLVMGSSSGAAEEPRADPWKITGEGRHLVEPEEGVASAPYSREVGGEEHGGRDAGFWVLIAIALVTAGCAAYALLSATDVL
jgi:hypothetical protein